MKPWYGAWSASWWRRAISIRQRISTACWRWGISRRWKRKAPGSSCGFMRRRSLTVRRLPTGKAPIPSRPRGTTCSRSCGSSGWKSPGRNRCRLTLSLTIRPWSTCAWSCPGRRMTCWTSPAWAKISWRNTAGNSWRQSPPSWRPTRMRWSK